ncbi:Flp pilus assembly protein CpaB [Microvirga sp. BT689]|uniref:Flp pilus assembly protein CpaB n=1 Tax=Microvirga arvi TaxID=2778731 RepID=UPI00194F1130|nr:Flp pilus assembly protein CpaB [Microvirga arvi]MBM6583666.1 Flp pilus assembly protein CpaB [Microvirga arvi]
MLRIIILIIALTAGSLAGWLALSLPPGAATAKVDAQITPVPMTEVLVASAGIAPGQALTEGIVRWQPWPMEASSPDFITRATKPDAVKSLIGTMVRSSFVSGEPIREEKLSRGSSNLLASMLTPGKRAVSIRISVESTAGGLILPNDRVDVIQTITRPGEDKNANLSRILLTNIRVLAVDQKMNEAKEPAAAVGKTATLELSPAQAEAIAGGQAIGLLSLALRSVADSHEEPTLQSNSAPSVRFLRAGQSETVRF